MNLTEYTITLALRAPVLTAAQGGHAFGIDSAMLRDWNGLPALPGSLVRGNLRHAWTDLNGYGADIDVAAWLGNEAGPDGSPSRARLRFSHWFSAVVPGDSDAVRHRIRIDEETDTVLRGALQVIETPFPAGEVVTFTGSITAEGAPPEMHRWLEKGLAWVAAFGADKGIGYGKVGRVAIAIAPRNPQPSLRISGDRLGLRLQFDRPICFSRPQIGKTEGNRYETEDFVPGAAIIGALSRHWPDRLSAQLSKIRVTHALPAALGVGQRPLAVPCSLAFFRDTLADLALASAKVGADGTAPAFQPDWKGGQWGEVLARCGWPELGRRLDVHTAIAADTGTAESGKLFSVESIDTRDREWLAEVDLAEIDDAMRDDVRQALVDGLREGLWPLGRTDAHAAVEIVPDGIAIRGAGDPGSGEAVVLALQSAAELLFPIPDASRIRRPADWIANYDAVFQALSGGALAVSRIFTRERLAGGKYLHRRFGRGDYRPWLLTLPGSVFVLRVNDAVRAGPVLADWLQHGLPSPAGEDWRTNPYRRQNGYGEVIFNPQVPAKENT